MSKIVVGEFEKKDVVLSWDPEVNQNEECEIVLEGEGAQVSVVGVFLGLKDAKYKNYVTVVHKGKNTKARISARGVALDSSRIDFSGMLRVEQGAKGADTYFDARFMVLSDKASAHTFPGLEIHENDIAKGGHAATVSQIREEELFYMMSRGLSAQTARSLVVRGFFESMIQLMDEGGQDRVRAVLEERLGDNLK